MKSGPGRPKHLRPEGCERNPAGSKIARRIAKHTGKNWNGEIFHGGALTAASDARAGRPAGWARCTL